VDRDQGQALKPPVAAAIPGPLTLRVITGEPQEMAALQAVLEAAPRYYDAVSGLPPGPAEAQSLITDLPPGKTYDDKIVWGLHAGAAMIGCADAIRGWNAPHKAIIGLLLLHEQWQGRGFGRAFALLIEHAIAARWPEIDTLRLGVVASNEDALAFWRALGYLETGEMKTGPPQWRADVIVFEKPLTRDAARA
jgi:GNAT superfamily N-acetyltransferase